MALPATGVWEVRTTGDDTNGGGFNAARGGTDYTLQDAAQLSLTDLACASNTTLTSATGGFTAAMVGNFVRINSGTNAAAGYYEITAYTSTNQVTIDRTCATGGNMTDGVGKVGGAAATLEMVDSNLVAGNTVWLKYSASAHATAAVVTIPGGSSGSPITICGYNSTRGDLADVNDWTNFPTLQRSGTGTNTMLALAAYSVVRCIIIDGSDYASNGIEASVAYYNMCENVQVQRCTNQGIAKCPVCVRCMVTDMKASSNAAFYSEGHCHFVGCIAHTNPCPGWRMYGGHCFLAACISYGNTGATSDGFRAEATYGGHFYRCVAYDNDRDGFRWQDTNSFDVGCAIGCIAYGNAGYGFNSNTTTWAWRPLDYNALRSNTAGGYNKLTGGANDVTLTADPFTDAAAGDFSLNTTAGGGAACRAAGYPGVLPGGLSTGYADIGAVQHADPAGGGVIVIDD